MAIVVSRAKRPPDKSDISFGLSGAGSGVDFRWFLSGSSREDQKWFAAVRNEDYPYVCIALRGTAGWTRTTDLLTTVSNSRLCTRASISTDG